MYCHKTLFGGHQWTNWERVDREMFLVDKKNDTKIPYTGRFQFRKCSLCDYVEEEELS